VRSDIDGAFPESFHSTLIEPPPVNFAPAAGLVNSTSARAKGVIAASNARSRNCIAKNTILVCKVDAIPSTRFDYRDLMCLCKRA
jgi:hypothetical protein